MDVVHDVRISVFPVPWVDAGSRPTLGVLGVPTMKFSLTLFGLFVAGFVAIVSFGCGPVPVLYAQSLPSVRTAEWFPNAAADNVVVYKLSLDAGAPIRVLPSACTGTPVRCTSQFSVSAYGDHVLSIRATNLAISTVPTSEQDGPPLNLPFKLSDQPGQVSGGTVR